MTIMSLAVLNESFIRNTWFEMKIVYTDIERNVHQTTVAVNLGSLLQKHHLPGVLWRALCTGSSQHSWLSVSLSANQRLM